MSTKHQQLNVGRRFPSPARVANPFSIALALLAAGEWEANPFVSRHRPEAVAITLVAVVAGAWVWQARGAVARSALVLAVVALAACAAGAGWRLQQEWHDHRYANATPAYAWASSVHGARIALAGSYLQYLLYGQDLSNRVQYLGRRGPHGAYVEISDCRAWRQALAAGGYDYVVTVPVDAGAPEPPQAGWTRTDPSAREVLRVEGQAVFRLDGRPHPEACA